MDKHVNDLLGAYVDDELDERTHQTVEQHLTQCIECWRDLTALQNLAGFLHQGDAARSRQTPRAFSASLKSLLPEREASASDPRTNLHWGWLALPTSLLIAGVILLSSSWITTLLLLGNQSGLLSGLDSLIPAANGPAGSLPLWQVLLQGILNANLVSNLTTLEAGWDAVDTFVLSLAAEGLLAVMYLAWLALVWNRRLERIPRRVSA